MIVADVEVGCCGGEEVAVDLMSNLIGEVEEATPCWGIFEVETVAWFQCEAHGWRCCFEGGCSLLLYVLKAEIKVDVRWT